jgi:hypothetical protein
MLANLFDIARLVYRVKMATDLFDTAPCRANDVIVGCEILDEEVLSCSGVDLISVIRHGLSTAGLVEREVDLKPKSLQKLKCSYPDLWIDHIDIARYEKPDARAFAICRFSDRC